MNDEHWNDPTYDIPPDFVTTKERMKPVAERRGERCQNLIFCAALFAGSGIVAGAIGMWLYAGGC